MTAYHAAAALTLTAVLLSSGRAETPAADDVQDLLVLTAARPLRLRFHVTLDGKPFRAAADAYLGALFADLDRNGDDALSRAEAARAPDAEFLSAFLAGGLVQDAQASVAAFARLDADGDGRVSRAEFVAYYKDAGLGRIHTTLAPPRKDGEALTSVLFQLLDRDHNGNLSHAELDRAAESLHRADLDEDEWITPEELLTFRPPARDGKSAAAFSLFARGADDDAERAKQWALPPDLELVVRLDSSPKVNAQDKNVPRVEIMGGRATNEHTTPDGALSISVGGVELEFQAADRPEDAFRSVARFYRQQFQAADADGKGVVDRAKAEASPVLAGVFALADRDGDGRLTDDEFKSFLDLHARGARSVLTLRAADESAGLFDLLDADGDGRLSLHELNAAWKRLAEYDRDGDGRIDRGELPSRLRLRLAVGRSNSLQATTASRPAPQAPTAHGPVWFRKMDRNGDGFVSWREFIGSEVLFHKLDADGDGLVSPEEAERAGDSPDAASGKP